MTIPASIDTLCTPEEYLAREHQAEFKIEYIDGQIVAMSGGTKRHSRVKLNLYHLVSTRFLAGPCDAVDCILALRDVYAKVQLPPAGAPPEPSSRPQEG